jgi:hypothetical protein
MRLKLAAFTLYSVVFALLNQFMVADEAATDGGMLVAPWYLYGVVVPATICLLMVSSVASVASRRVATEVSSEYPTVFATVLTVVYCAGNFGYEWPITVALGAVEFLGPMTPIPTTAAPLAPAAMTAFIDNNDASTISRAPGVLADLGAAAMPFAVAMMNAARWPFHVFMRAIGLEPQEPHVGSTPPQVFFVLLCAAVGGAIVLLVVAPRIIRWRT